MSDESIEPCHRCGTRDGTFWYCGPPPQNLFLCKACGDKHIEELDSIPAAEVPSEQG